jgi:multiple sugar transport system substrate-binding protein
MANEQIAMMVGFAPTPDIIQKLNPNLDVKNVLRMAPIPTEGKEKATAAWISSRVISAYTKHPEEAWRLYKFIHDYENQVRWFRGAGVLSSRTDVRFSEEVMNNSFARVMAEQAPYARFEPLVLEWPEIGDAMITAIQDTLSGRKSADKALADLHNEVNAILIR